MKVIAISGHAQNGKDTVASMLREKLEEKGNKVLVAHYADLVKYICKTFFGWNGVKDEVGRTLLQYVGTDVVRAQRPDYWVDFIVDVLTLFDDWDYVIIPDTRFPNEIEKLKEQEKFDVVHWRVVRTGFDNRLTEEQKSHPSETALDDVTPDCFIYNDGTLDNLNVTLNKIMEDKLYA